MSSLRQDTVNWLNLHYAIHVLALSGGGVFFGTFLLHAGLSIPQVFLALGAIYGGRFLIRPIVLVLAKLWGLRTVLIVGTVLSSVQYPMLAEVHGVGWLLAAVCLVSSAGDTLYWTAYHAYFAALGDHERRGQQIGAREAVASVFAILGPLATGWALTVLGPRAAFGATALILASAALPLLGSPPVAVAHRAAPMSRAVRGSVLIYVADGWIGSGFYFVWEIALFLSLGENFAAYGGAVALAGLIGAASGLLLGRWIDKGHGVRAVWAALGGMAVVMALRILAHNIPILAVAANALGAVAIALYTPTMMTAVYNAAKRSPCPLRFHLATEGGYDAGCAGGCFSAAALTASGLPVWTALLLPLLGAAASFILLRRYYAAQADALFA